MDSVGLSRTPLTFHDPSTLEISTEISLNDGMYAGNVAHYLGVGHSALRCIQNSLLLVGAPEPKRILDLPSGHGRVLRALRARFPTAEITACDLERDGVDYCAQAFDAVPAYSVDDPEEIALSGPYDLIWCGSLLTHLPMGRWEPFLQLFDNLLAPGGVVVFTTHGRKTEGWLRRDTTDAGLSMEQMYGLTQSLVTDLLEGLAQSGFGYVDYPNQHGYGISVSSLPFVVGLVQRATGLRVATCLEHGWDEHQDVIACAKPEIMRDLRVGEGKRERPSRAHGC